MKKIENLFFKRITDEEIIKLINDVILSNCKKVKN